LTDTPGVLELARKKLTKRNAGGGTGNLPLRRRYIREHIEQKPRGGNDDMTRPQLEARVREIDQELAVNKIKGDSVQLAQAEALNAKADEYSRVHGIDYITALREVYKSETLKLSQEPTVAEVEARMQQDGVGFEDALHSILQSGRYDAAVHAGGGTGLSDQEYDKQLKQRMEEMGIDH
jgi:hypothetical protein